MRNASAGGFIRELDGLRGIAILLVILHRVFPRTDGTQPWFIEAGWVGVDLFFVVSGFLIAGILIDTHGDANYLRNFYARRALRIFPLFYLLVAGMFIAFPLAGNAGFVDAAGSPAWYLLHLGNVPEALLGYDPPYWLAPVWSLAIEEQFYWAFPLLVAAVTPRRLGRWLVGFAALSLVIRVATTLLFPEHERLQYLFTLCRLDTIAAGCLLAVFVRTPHFEGMRARLPRWLGGVALVTGVIALATQLDRTTFFGRTLGYSVVAVCFASIVLLVVVNRGQRATAFLRWAPLCYLGKLCFGLYLLHRPADTLVSAAAARVGLAPETLWLVPVKVGAAIVLATISWRLLEVPALRLKKHFESQRHPGGAAARVALVGIVAALIACNGPVDSSSVGGDTGTSTTDAGEPVDDAGATDAQTDAQDDDAAPPDAPPAVPQPARIQYREAQLHSPITSEVATALAAIASTTATNARLFAKVGDSITANDYFFYCYTSSPSALFDTTAFRRRSVAAAPGWTADDVLSGSPSRLTSELDAIDPRFAIVMLGTNDVRLDRSIDAYGTDLWTIVDQLRGRGVVPVLSTIPTLVSDPVRNRRVPLINRVIRAIAQGRKIPLVDYHLALEPLPNKGISGDGIHPSIAPEGACATTAAAMEYGYNVRNDVTLDALERAARGAAGQASDTSIDWLYGAGTIADPYLATLPFADLGDTRGGDAVLASYGSCGMSGSGSEAVYRFDLAQRMTLRAHIVDRGGVAVDVAILDGAATATACAASGDSSVSATVGPGAVYVVVDSVSASTQGEYLLVVQRD